MHKELRSSGRLGGSRKTANEKLRSIIGNSRVMMSEVQEVEENDDDSEEEEMKTAKCDSSTGK
jgi:hypothetical protein